MEKEKNGDRLTTETVSGGALCGKPPLPPFDHILFFPPRRPEIKAKNCDLDPTSDTRKGPDSPKNGFHRFGRFQSEPTDPTFFQIFSLAVSVTIQAQVNDTRKIKKATS